VLVEDVGGCPVLHHQRHRSNHAAGGTDQVEVFQPVAEISLSEECYLKMRPRVFRSLIGWWDRSSRAEVWNARATSRNVRARSADLVGGSCHARSATAITPFNWSVRETRSCFMNCSTAQLHEHQLMEVNLPWSSDDAQNRQHEMAATRHLSRSSAAFRPL
jgi:hypothetical protein